MSFQDVVQRLSDRTDTEVGLHVVEFVLQNRVDNDRIYQSGDIIDFRNKEMNRVHGGLLALAQEWHDPPSPQLVEERFGESPLGRYLQITRICYCYDVLKAGFQASTGPSQDRLLGVSSFIFERLRKASLSRPEQMSEYQWKKETVRQEYVRILNSMKNALNERTGIIYEMHR